jgi:hypothetical protein
MGTPRSWKIQSTTPGIIDSAGNTAIIFGRNTQPQYAADNTALQIYAQYTYIKSVQTGVDAEGNPVFQDAETPVPTNGNILRVLTFDQINTLYAQIEPFLTSVNYMDKREEAQYRLQLGMLQAEGITLWGIPPANWELIETTPAP